MTRYFIISRKRLFIGVAIIIALIAAIVFLSVGQPAQAVSASQRKLPIYCTKQEEKKISISFDAAWGAEDTDLLIEILGKYNVKVTFFVVGEWVDKYPEEVKKLHDAGHEVQNHSSTHPHMTNLSKSDMVKEIEGCNSKIEAITGVRPTLLRPPYGDYNNAVVEAVESCSMYTIQWDVDSLDWKGISAADITKRVTSKVRAGSIVLFHNAAENTPEALPSILEQLLADGYTFVPISQLIYKSDYTIDTQGMQIPNSSPASSES